LTEQRSSSTHTQDGSEHPPIPAVPQVEADGDADHDGHDTRQPKSPLLTSHRLSTSSLDNVNLDEDGTPLKPSLSKGIIQHLR
jgi:hypothetical protein